MTDDHDGKIHNNASAISKTFVEFFAGVGIVRLGLESDQWRCLFANDHDPVKEKIYVANHGADHFQKGDVAAINPSALPAADLFTVSFPCTDLSLAGGRKGLAGRGSGAFFSFIQIVRKLRGNRPKLILIENVTGFLTSHGGADIVVAIDALNELGYGVDLFIGDARWFTPQSRPRLFIVAQKGRGGVCSHLYENRDPRLTSPGLRRVIDRAMAQGTNLRFQSIPPPPNNPMNLSTSTVIETSGVNGWFTAQQVNKLLSQMSVPHRERVETFVASHEISYIPVFKRMRNHEVRAEARFDGLAGCLRTPRGGSSKQILLAVGQGKIAARYLTAREYCRLQGVEDTFSLPVSQSAGQFALGDAVCAPLITWIGRNILTPILLAE